MSVLQPALDARIRVHGVGFGCIVQARRVIVVVRRRVIAGDDIFILVVAVGHNVGIGYHSLFSTKRGS
jgi:hypothetical protein